MINLEKVAEEIRTIVSNRQKELSLTFEEESHTYTMKDSDGNLSSEWPSVSTVLKTFYTPFPADEIAEKKSKGDLEYKEQLLKEWSEAGSYATNLGSRVHFILEKDTLEMFNVDKEVREPIFDCDFTQILKGDAMINGGRDFLKIMKERGAVLLDTEMVLGDPELGYTGQPDKMWLIYNPKLEKIGLVISDWKSNKPKNFESTYWTKDMLPPFTNLPDNALGHYYCQLPFYCKLLLKMLEGSEYGDISIFGGIVVLVKESGEFEEFRVPKKTQQTILDMNMSKYLTKSKK
jgi:hypothetical protein|tara:strand:- start:7037 stop:7906 length:870 start_codon:yes stop_codon:yes gene_type:complete